MLIFDFPPQAEKETGCFSVFDRNGQEELLFVPPLTSPEAVPAFDGWICYLPPAPALSSMPISEKTLVSEADALARNPVWVSSRLCGGTLEQRLSEAKTAYGDRLWLLIEPFRTLLPLPCPDGRGEEVDMIPDCVLQDADAFCCKYCVVFSGKPKLFLLDTEQTVRRKLALAERLGIGHVVIFP